MLCVCDEWSHGERTTPRITLVTGSYLALQRRMAHTDFTVALWREKEIGRSYEGLLSSSGGMGFTVPLLSYIPHVDSFSYLFSDNRIDVTNLYFEVWVSQVMVLSESLKGIFYYYFKIH